MDCSIFIYMLFTLLALCQISTSLDEGDLLTNILKTYNKNRRPVRNNSEPVLVTMDMTVQQLISLNEVEEKISARAWIRYTWIDEFLKWNLSEYNVSSVELTADKIWIPDIVLYNSVSIRSTTPNHENSLNIPVPISHDGRVLRMYPTILKAFCKLDVTDFPMDQQICAFKFGSWIYTVNQVNLFNKTDASQSLEYIRHDGEWQFIEMQVKRHEVYYPCCPVAQADVTYYLVLRRQPLTYMFSIVFPSWLVLVTSIFGSILLPTMSGEKVSLQITCLLALSVILLTLGELMPRQSEVIARIEAFFGGCVAIMALMAVSEICVVHIFYKGELGEPLSPSARKFCFEKLAPMLRMESYVNSLKLKQNTTIKNKRLSTNDLMECKICTKNGQDCTHTLESAPLLMSPITNSNDVVVQQLTTKINKLKEKLNRKRQQEQQEAAKNEWKIFATIVGRLTGILFLFATSLLTIIIFLRDPNYSTSRLHAQKKIGDLQDTRF